MLAYANEHRKVILSISNNEVKSEELKRQLSPMHVWALAFGCVVGWGSFINPGKKFLPNSGVARTAIAMVLQSDISVHVHVHL